MFGYFFVDNEFLFYIVGLCIVHFNARKMMKHFVFVCINFGLFCRVTIFIVGNIVFFAS